MIRLAIRRGVRWWHRTARTAAKLLTRVRRASRRLTRRAAKPLVRLRTHAVRAERRITRRSTILVKPWSGLGVTILRRSSFVRLKQELLEARTESRRPVDLRSVTSDPVEAAYLAGGRGRPFLLDVTLDRCRGVGISPSNLGSPANPFVMALRAALASGSEEFAGSPLADYYRRVQPSSAAAVVGLGAETRLAQYPPSEPVLPWQKPEELFSRFSRHAADRARQIVAEDGKTEYGPVSDTKGAEEIRRLLRVYRSIERHGFRGDEFGYVSATILVGEREWACQVLDGYHRVAALAALNRERVTVCATPALIRRTDVDSWPQVRRGLFSRDEALQVFDRLLRG